VSYKHSYFSWWLAPSRPKHVEKRNKNTKKNCAPSWLYLQDNIRDTRSTEHKIRTHLYNSVHRLTFTCVFLYVCWFPVESLRGSNFFVPLYKRRRVVGRWSWRAGGWSYDEGVKDTRREYRIECNSIARPFSSPYIDYPSLKPNAEVVLTSCDLFLL
jgi:hypothetical protein